MVLLFVWTIASALEAEFSCLGSGLPVTASTVLLRFREPFCSFGEQFDCPSAVNDFILDNGDADTSLWPGEDSNGSLCFLRLNL